mgnify:FL=1
MKQEAHWLKTMGSSPELGEKKRMNQIVSLFMFSCGDYEKVKQDVWEENWKAMRLYSVVALVAFGVITLVSVFSLSIGKFKWVYLVYTFLSLVYFCISRCQLRSFLGKKLVVYSFFAALLLFGIITGTLITPEEFTVNYIVFMVAASLLFTADRAYIFEQNDRGTFDNTYEWCKAGVPKEKDNLQDVPYEGIIETWFAQYQESNNVIIHDIEECKKTSEAIYERLKPQGVNTLVTGPIKINGKMVGFYGVDNPPEEKLHEISKLIDMIEFMISFMIRLRNNADVLEHSALYDLLTDCKNRKALDWVYTEKLEKYFPLAVVMCDLNGLKEINDQKGHDAGDKFIVQATQTLKSVFGKRHVYRLGGDEFIAVLPNITHPAFQKLLETAKSQLGATASLGTTISGTKDTDFESLLKAADAEMYENKKQYYIVTGKDRRKHSL